MPPIKRLPHNRKLPARWAEKHGAFYYLVPPEVRHLWDGKTWFRLGGTLPEAYRAWAERVGRPQNITMIRDLIDRYILEVIPKKKEKSAKTASENLRQIERFRPAFDKMNIQDIEPHHIYKYFEKRTAKVAAKKEIEVLSHIFTKAVEWGELKQHPFKGQVRIENPSTPRDRYVEDWELIELLAMKPRKRKGSLGMVQAYLKLKLLTGLRQRDLLLLTAADLRDDGIFVKPSKTKNTTGAKRIYEWTPALRAAVEECKAWRPALSPYLFCNGKGECLVDEEEGTAKGFNDIWQNCMTRLLSETKVTERFTEHDLRAKVSSDAESLARAQELLAHADAKMTEKFYRRKPQKIAPAG